MSSRRGYERRRRLQTDFAIMGDMQRWLITRRRFYSERNGAFIGNGEGRPDETGAEEVTWKCM